MNPLITIIIPVYNGENFIRQCLDSILNQLYNNLQIIVIDDGSTDNTSLILDEYKSKDSRFEIIHQDNKGVSKARNIGLKLIRGKWLCFIDADDYIKPDYCSSIVNTAELLDVDILICQLKSTLVKGYYYLSDYDNLIKACLSHDELNFSFNIDAPWGKLFKTSVLKRNNIIFPENLSRSEDAYFCMNYYYYSKKICILDNSGYVHVERNGSLCRSYSPQSMEMLEKILETNKKWIDKIYNNNNQEFLFSLWYRVLPGIVECEKVYFLHKDCHETYFNKIKSYQHFLNQPMIKSAIKNLKLVNISKRQYFIRLLFYKINLGWLFILFKMNKK